MVGGIEVKASAQLLKHEPMLFKNSQYKNLTFEQVYELLLDFIKEAPDYQYRLSIGTDSQVKNSTVFATAIHLHRVGRGAIGFISTQVVSRPIRSIREKIYKETCRTLEVAALFTPDKIDRIVEILLSSREHHGDIKFEFHLDIGTSGATKDLIGEMIAIASGTAFEPKIKPESYAATSYADKYAKNPPVQVLKHNS